MRRPKRLGAVHCLGFARRAEPAIGLAVKQAFAKPKALVYKEGRGRSSDRLETAMTGAKSEEERKADKAKERRARLGEELRANLLRRKAQSRVRRKTATTKDEDFPER